MAHDPSTDALEAESPGWHCWAGVGGLVYARRMLSSPPIVHRDETTAGLRVQIRATEDELSR